jgi:hypothetical protein
MAGELSEVIRMLQAKVAATIVPFATATNFKEFTQSWSGLYGAHLKKQLEPTCS